MDIAVIGSGISGLSAAWMLSKHHSVDLFEKDDRLGGHANTQSVDTQQGPIDIDTGFIVYNEKTYPNLTALFDHIGVQTAASDMSFSASLSDGMREYSGQGLRGLLAQPSNMVSPRFYRMLRDIYRFYNEATTHAGLAETRNETLGSYLTSRSYSKAFIHDHLLPMGAAIWSMPSDQMLDFPFEAFMRFSINHGLVQFKDRPQWRTLPGGSKRYVDRLGKQISGSIHLNSAISEIIRRPGSVTIRTRQGVEKTYDHLILACHSDQALKLLQAGAGESSDAERTLLSAIPYQRNLAILHRDKSLMPKRRAAWASWNYLQSQSVSSDTLDDESKVSVTYWMNRLQPLATEENFFVTLNPTRPPREGTVCRSFIYDHPVFSIEAMEAQKQLWHLQGHRRTWFCGAYFGYGFHEDGLQAGLAVAEQLGGTSRPWSVEAPNGRIHVTPRTPHQTEPLVSVPTRTAAE